MRLSSPAVLRRRLVWMPLAVVLVLLVAALGFDTVVAIRAEQSLARALMQSTGPDGTPSTGLRFEPEVTISGFPAYRSVADGRYAAIGITARAVDAYGTATFARGLQPHSTRECTRANPCRADLRSRLTDVRAGRGHSLWNAFPARSALGVGGATSSTTLDSVAVGRFLGIDDLTVNTPAPRDAAGGGGPQDGLLSRTSGVLLTGTVRAPGPSARRVTVSVEVDLSVRDGLLHLQATGFYDGPQEHSTNVVPPADREQVLSQFTATFPSLPMAWGAAATSARSSGSDLILEGSPQPQQHRGAYFPAAFLGAERIYMLYAIGRPR